MTSKLLSIGFAVPDELVMTQDDVLKMLGYTSKRARRIFMNAGIATRHFAMNPVGKSWQQLRDAYRPAALKLSCQAVEHCMDGRNLDDLGLLVFSSVTDYSTPALGYYIARELGLRRDVVFTNIQGQGCQSAVPGLRRATEFHHATGRTALVVNTEICSATFFPASEDDLENTVSNSLFGDASAAFLVGEDDNPRHPVIMDFESAYDPAALDILGFTWVDGRLKCRLDKSVPEVVPPLVKDAVTRLIRRHGATPGDVLHWAIHPGGPAVLRRIESLLGLTRSDTWASWDTMREVGNCSSATLAMIGKRVHELPHPHPPTPVEHGQLAVGVTAGAGGSTEAVLLRYG